MKDFISKIRIIMEVFKCNIKYKQIEGKRIFFLPSILNL